MADRQTPHFPDILVSADVSGEVRVRFVVDASGHTVESSFVTLQSTHELFTAAVRAAAKNWLFLPAQLRGRRVAVRREEMFVFRTPVYHPLGYADPKAFAYGPFRVMTSIHDTTSDGVPRTVVEYGPLARIPPGKFSRNELLAAQRAALAAVAPPPAEPGFSEPGIVTLCVSIQRDSATVPADPETLRSLVRPGRRAVVPHDCPRTYESMAAIVDSLGNPVHPPPPGWVDPYGLKITAVEGWARDIVRVAGEVGHGSGRRGFICRMQRMRAVWTAECQRTWSSVS